MTSEKQFDRETTHTNNPRRHTPQFGVTLTLPNGEHPTSTKHLFYIIGVFHYPNGDIKLVAEDRTLIHKAGEWDSIRFHTSNGALTTIHGTTENKGDKDDHVHWAPLDDVKLHTAEQDKPASKWDEEIPTANTHNISVELIDPLNPELIRMYFGDHDIVNNFLDQSPDEEEKEEMSTDPMTATHQDALDAFRDATTLAELLTSFTEAENHGECICEDDEPDMPEDNTITVTRTNPTVFDHGSLGTQAYTGPGIHWHNHNGNLIIDDANGIRAEYPAGHWYAVENK